MFCVGPSPVCVGVCIYMHMRAIPRAIAMRGYSASRYPGDYPDAPSNEARIAHSRSRTSRRRARSVSSLVPPPAR